MTTESALGAVVFRLRRDTADRNPVSREQHERARAVLPGGSTRTILHHAPFPLTFVEGHEGTLTDADGHRYVDLVGDYTAGLLGHSEKRVHAAVAEALANNTSVGGVHPAEIRFAELVCSRFGHQRVRFTNSGTEANLFAITLSRIVTGRSTIMVMHGGYHGGVFYYSNGNAPWNAPFPTIIAPYNDLEACEQLIDDYRSELAAVIVEPMLGSGCVPAESRFLGGLANATQRAEAIFITDEVMTSRHGPRGLADLLGVRPDIATFGKYFAGGFSFGAFAGRAELLDRFDASKPDSIPHAGTFNNNVATMSAGCVVLGELFTSDTAVGLTARGEDLRARIDDVLHQHKLPLNITGFGSMNAVHALERRPLNGADLLERDPVLQEALFLSLLQRGVYTAPRGSLNLGLAVTDSDLDLYLSALDDALGELSDEM
ncbi:MAG TPA: aminotransferase class III-fold pyridoxal phosphate-dependent enzyme [Ilumatobacteraceae bacterium]|nr:aminotransferase class III-fold pyridoxal phosphate-dependent enzyme [Ilumatobacteraceae bacterium]